MEEPHLIFGIHVTNRATQAGRIQELLTEYGCNIKTRIGLHHVTANACSPRGLILLEMYGDVATCRGLATRLSALEGVEVKEMFFEH